MASVDLIPSVSLDELGNEPKRVLFLLRKLTGFSFARLNSEITSLPMFFTVESLGYAIILRSLFEQVRATTRIHDCVPQAIVVSGGRIGTARKELGLQ
jgi:hypothetical protein